MCCRCNSSGIFVSYCGTVHLPGLHSFPTRRSSDLTLEFDDSYELTADSTVSGSGTVVFFGSSAQNNKSVTVAGDRERARLNSSHTEISYVRVALTTRMIVNSGSLTGHPLFTLSGAT